ncbi:MAG: DUF3574 domain-containing protein [Lachnospiraceae bacterium]|nr:DUF3574 domain-containing protein [Lachnospiraceae bacterium]
MNKTKERITLVLAALALCLSIVSLFLSLKPQEQEKADVQYVLYLGTNDKDTNESVFTPEEAKERAEEILIRHFGGYTIQEANGGWEDAGTRYTEYTLVIYLSDTTVDQVHAAADDMIRTFNQSSVLIQENQTRTEFYSGTH